jgi:hypothetical protein
MLPELQYVEDHVALLRQQITNDMIEFKNLQKKLESSPNNWKELIQEMIEDVEVYNTYIHFDFVQCSLPSDLKRTFLWLGVSDEGVQTWNNNLIGLNFKDAIIRAIYKNPYDFVMYYDFESIMENEFPEIDISSPISLETVDAVANKIIEYIEKPEVDGDSFEQIIIFDITEPTNKIEMICPKFKNC